MPGPMDIHIASMCRKDERIEGLKSLVYRLESFLTRTKPQLAGVDQRVSTGLQAEAAILLSQRETL